MAAPTIPASLPICASSIRVFGPGVPKTNGMPLLFTAAIKPTPSISRPQQTVNLETGEITTLEIKGRHDPCIVPRAVPVVEAAAAIAIFDAWLEYKARR